VNVKLEVEKPQRKYVTQISMSTFIQKSFALDAIKKSNRYYRSQIFFIMEKTMNVYLST